MDKLISYIILGVVSLSALFIVTPIIGDSLYDTTSSEFNVEFVSTFSAWNDAVYDPRSYDYEIIDDTLVVSDSIQTNIVQKDSENVESLSFVLNQDSGNAQYNIRVKN